MTSACRSMTGYASVQRTIEGWRIACELRGVNSRFLDLVFRIPDEARAAESALRDLITAQLSRGKVECRVALQRVEAAATGGDPDDAALNRLALWQERVKAALPDAASISVAEALRWPGVIAETALDPDTLRDAIVEGVRAALQEFEASRGREGARLSVALVERTEKLQAIVDTLKPRLPELREAYRERIADRLTEALGATPERPLAMSRDEIAARLSSEVAVFALRADVDEELTRLESHIVEVRRVVGGQVRGSVGKRLDFLMQELNREANTLGSKAVANELSDASIEMKLLIEQMREQVQNLE